MRIYYVKIRNFRGIKSADFNLAESMVCLIGAGDSTKSTILDAVEYVLSPNWFIPFDDSDFTNCDVSKEILIEVTVGPVPEEFLSDTKFGLHLRGWSESKEKVVDEPRNDDIRVLTIRLKVNQYKAPFMLKDKPGYFDICGYEVSALDLSALYLAVIIKQIKAQLAAYVDENADIQEVYMNMAAPLDQLNRYYEVVEKASKEDRSKILLGNVVRDTRLSEYYMKLGQWFLRLSNQSQNPWVLEDALMALKEVKEKGVIPFEKSPAYVLPETVAAISAYINRPRTRQGRFISFDVGAGTTDVSVFWLQKKQGAPKPSYYASGSLHLGMDGIDVSLLDILPQANDSSLRQRREILEEIDGSLRKYEDRWKPILGRIEKHKDRVFGLAYDKEKICAHWGDSSHANVTLLMLGGGCQSSVMEKIRYLSLWGNFIGVPSAEILQLDFTEKVILPDGTEGLLSEIPVLSKQANLLVVAEGLAQRIIDICDYEITTEPILIRPRIPKESYLTGHWW